MIVLDDENVSYFLCATVFAHLLLNRILAISLRDHKVYGRAFGSYQTTYWSFLHSMFIQLFVFVPLGFLLFLHYDFDIIKLRSSSAAKGYSPYTRALSCNIIAYMLSTLENCWPHWDLLLHHIGGFSTTLLFLYEDDSLDIYLLGIVCLEIGSFTMNFVELVKGTLEENTGRQTAGGSTYSYYERWLNVLNTLVFTVGHIFGVWCVHEIVFVQQGRRTSTYFRYWFLFQSANIIALRQKAVISPFFYQIKKDKGKSD